jgi:hypothetical protein
MLRSMIVITAILTSQISQAMTCKTQTMTACDDGVCQQVQSPNQSWIDLDSNTLKRCDNKGCDTYKSSVERSGEFINVSIGNKGYLLKVDGQGKFVEVATIMLKTIIKTGRCL